MVKYVFFYQSFDLTTQEMEWVCDHLGHNINVHRTHYRAMSDSIERIKIAKLLLAQDLGVVGENHGKDLDSITFEGWFEFVTIFLVFNRTVNCLMR
jgi:hypothetical protein